MVDIQGVAGSALNLSIILFAFLFLAVLTTAASLLFLRWKRWNEFKVTIWEKNGNETKDNASIFVDKKTHNKRFFLRKNNVGLNADDVPYRRIGASKHVYLIQHGLKNFRFVDLNHFVDGVVEKKAGKIIVGEEDVNWAINSYERQKKLFGNSLLMQYLPFIMLTFTSILILIIFIYFFKQFPVLKEMAVEMKEAAKFLAQAKSGTVIVE